MNNSQITAQRLQLDAAARDLDVQIKNAAANRDWSMLAELERRVNSLTDDRAELDRADATASAVDQFAAKFPDAATESDHPAGETITKGYDNGKRLAFGLKMAEGLVSRKSLATTGAAITSQDFRPDPVALGKPATGLLDVIPTVGHGTPQYSYLRQTTRTNNAAVVADGSTKPTSIYGVTRIENSLSIIAHLSEGIPHYWLNDNPTLTSFVQNELNYGLQRAVEAKVLADINATSGIAVQAFATSVPVSIRKSMTLLETTGYTPQAIVLHPSDFETIELLLSTTNAVERLGLPYDAAARRLYGVPIATTIAQTAGTAHVLGHGAVAVDHDTLGIQLRWSETATGTAFAQNLVVARLEGRWGTSVYQPAGVVKTALVAS